MIKRTAFTMVEILVVIAIIVILMGLLVLGVRHVTNSSKGRSTDVTMKSLAGMLGDYDAKTRLTYLPPNYRWFNGTQAVDGLDGRNYNAGSYDFWRVPFMVNAGSSGRLEPLDAPGQMEYEGPLHPGPGTWTAPHNGTGLPPALMFRHASRQVLNTQIVMAMLLAMPGNRAAIEKVAADRLFVPEWQWGPVPAPGADGVTGTSDDGGTDVVHYYAGAHVQYNGQKFVCTVTHDENSNSPPSTGSTNWKPETSSAPLLLDAWNNPIIFVNGTGLRVRLLNGQSTFSPTDPKQNFIVTSPEGRTSRDASNVPFVVQTGRPFWASAGPDGDFSKGDDNVYSFSQ